MKNILFSLLILATAIPGIAQSSNLNQSINHFSFKVFEQIYNNQANCFYSPYSIYGALSMTYEGAEKTTKLEMGKVLEIGNKESASKDFMLLTNQLKKNNNIKFLSSNSIWLHKTLKIKRPYSKLIAEYYDAKSKNVDFVDEANREKARVEINEWIEKGTNKQIKNFIKKGILTESTGMVLVNAIYFKALWQKEFSTKETKPERFLAASGDSVKCKMMNTLLPTNYFEDEHIQAVEIPYKDKGASMVLFMAKETSKADISILDYKYYNEVVNSFEPKHVKLSIPKFKMDINYELSKVMKKMGMKTAFKRDADFSKITGGKDLTISNVLHQSIVEVSEKGTEASSTTAVISMRSAMVTKDIPVVFKADQPFVFVIKENTTNAILFMGYMAEPPSGLAASNNEIQKVKQVQTRDD